MNKQSLYLFGGALMATTALTTGANAATIKDFRANISGSNLPSTSAITSKSLATEVFSASSSALANGVTLGAANTTSTASAILIDFAAQLTTGFNIQLNVTGAGFTGTPTVVVYGQTTTGSLVAASVTSCTIQALPDKLLINGCTPQGSGSSSRADAMVVYGIQYISASALGTAGQTVKLDGIVRDSTGATTFETITSATVITSKSAAQTGIQTGSALTIDNNATPVFARFTTASATGVLGTIQFSVTGAVGTDLSNTFAAIASITGASEVKIAHSALSDPALVSISIPAATLTATPAAFVAGTVSFQVPAANLALASITVTFNGSTGITASSGTGTATVTPTTTGAIIRAVSPFSGNLASLTRGGLNVELNSLFPTSGQGSTLYRSLLRIANTSAIDGVATLTVKNDSTGATIGSFTTTVTAGSTKQIMSSDIEAAVTTAAATGAAYNVVVSGSFNGYVQHLLWNSVTGLFTDLSGFRNGALTVDP